MYTEKCALRTSYFRYYLRIYDFRHVVVWDPDGRKWGANGRRWDPSGRNMRSRDFVKNPEQNIFPSGIFRNPPGRSGNAPKTLYSRLLPACATFGARRSRARNPQGFPGICRNLQSGQGWPEVKPWRSPPSRDSAAGSWKSVVRGHGAPGAPAAGYNNHFIIN